MAHFDISEPDHFSSVVVRMPVVRYPNPPCLTLQEGVFQQVQEVTEGTKSSWDRVPNPKRTHSFITTDSIKKPGSRLISLLGSVRVSKSCNSYRNNLAVVSLHETVVPDTHRALCGVTAPLCKHSVVRLPDLRDLARIQAEL